MSRKMVKVIAWVALAAFVVICAASLTPFGAFAETAQQRANQAEKRQKELQAEIDKNKQQQSSEMQKKTQVDAELAQVQEQINALDVQIAASDEKIAVKEAELAAAQEESNRQNAAYQQRVKMMVERGAMSYLEVLLSADSF